MIAYWFNTLTGWSLIFGVWLSWAALATPSPVEPSLDPPALMVPEIDDEPPLPPTAVISCYLSGIPAQATGAVDLFADGPDDAAPAMVLAVDETGSWWLYAISDDGGLCFISHGTYMAPRSR